MEKCREARQKAVPSGGVRGTRAHLAVPQAYLRKRFPHPFTTQFSNRGNYAEPSRNVETAEKQACKRTINTSNFDESRQSQRQEFRIANKFNRCCPGGNLCDKLKGKQRTFACVSRWLLSLAAWREIKRAGRGTPMFHSAAAYDFRTGPFIYFNDLWHVNYSLVQMANAHRGLHMFLHTSRFSKRISSILTWLREVFKYIPVSLYNFYRSVLYVSYFMIIIRKEI